MKDAPVVPMHSLGPLAGCHSLLDEDEQNVALCIE